MTAIAPVSATAGVEAILIVVPPIADCVIGGLPLVRRIVLAATSAGYEQILVSSGGAGLHDVLAGTRANELTAATALPALRRRRVVVIPANVVPEGRWLRALLGVPVERETLSVDGSRVAVVDTEDPGAVVATAARAEDASGLMAELRRMFPAVRRADDPDGRFPIVEAGDVGRAERWLLRTLIKQREGFMSRHVERRLSLALTRRLAGTAVTPNMMTVISAAIGLCGAACFVVPARAWQLTGALLFLAHSILDGCDGELARLRFQQSRWGAVLDFWGDNVVHVAVFLGIAVGWSRSIGAAWPLGLGAVAAVATLGSAAVFFGRTVEDRVAVGGASVGRVVDALGSRDFIYVVVLLSAFGKATWFLVAAAVGTPVYLLLALWLDGRHGSVR